jgi:hypothetical protein
MTGDKGVHEELLDDLAIRTVVLDDATTNGIATDQPVVASAVEEAGEIAATEVAEQQSEVRYIGSR